MKFHVQPVAVGLAVALMLGMAQESAAQTPTKSDTTRRTPRSSTRIPVVKESPGEVVVPDSAVTPPPAAVPAELPPPPAPLVAVTPAPVVRPVRLGPLYFLLGAGAVLAQGNGNEVEWNPDLCIPGGATDPISRAHRSGFTTMAGVGYDQPWMPLGVRFDVAYTRFTTFANIDPTGQYNFSSEPELWSGNLDLKLRAPFVPLPNAFSVYGVGGASYNRYRVRNVQNGPINPTSFSAVSGWNNTWGYNAGAGLEYTWRTLGVFAETRWFRFNNVREINHIPVILGVRIL